MQKRREQRWVSHNKVLVGSGDSNGSKKPHARNPNFDSEETRLLITLWGDPLVQRTLITIHKKHPVIAKIAEKMRAHGYNRSTEEINTRIKNLKCLYNRIKKDLDSGLLNEPSWKHYNAMDEILSRPVFGNKNVCTTSSNVTTPTSLYSNKIVISPSFSSTSDGEQQMFEVKQENISDDEDNCGESSMDYEGNELRPEDLLKVVEVDNESDVEIKEEPLEVPAIFETKNEAKTDADSSTDTSKKSETSQINIAASISRNIINYQNDSSLSILSVHGNNSSTAPSPVSPSTNSSIGSKISLVPTNLLLKSQTGFKSPPPLVTPTSTITTNAQSSSQSIPMKVVFVNAYKGNPNAQQNATNQQLITLSKSQAQLVQNSSPTFVTSKIINQAQPTKVQLVSQLCNDTTNSPASSISPNNIAKVSAATSSHSHRRESSEKKLKSSKSLLGSNKLPVIRNLLTNIVEIENQRLELERQRFEYEKNVGNELLSLLKSFIGNTNKKNQPSDKSN